jgi:apolipoprotein N-acyltransferase
LITNGGIIGPTTGLATAEVLTGTVRLRSGGPTFYTRFGDWVPLVAVAALAVSITQGKRAGGHPKAAPDTGSR